MGNWSYDILDDFTNPDGRKSDVADINNFKDIHTNFAINWLLEDQEDRFKGGALFTKEFGRTSSYFANKTFVPEFRRWPNEILPGTR